MILIKNIKLSAKLKNLTIVEN